MRNYIAAMSLVGLLGCEEPLELKRILPNTELIVQGIIRENPIPPPKEETRFYTEKKEGENGELIFERKSYLVKDLPPRILKAEQRGLGWFDVKIINEGLNPERIHYIAIINSKDKVLKKYSFFPENCHDGDKDQLPYCLEEKSIYLSSQQEPGEYKYFIEVKDDYHTVRSKPLVFKVVDVE